MRFRGLVDASSENSAEVVTLGTKSGRSRVREVVGRDVERLGSCQ